MAPNDMSNDQLLDEHGKRLNNHDERLNIHAQRFDRYDLLLYGDDKSKIEGLVQSMDDLKVAVNGLLEWRKELAIYGRVILIGGRVALILLGFIGAGVWWPQIQALIKLLGG